jgi:hypothetical protein
MRGTLPARRLAVVIMLGLLAAAGLVACRSDPAVAAYVGDTEITEAQVNEVLDALRAMEESRIEEQLAGLAEQVSEETLAQHRQERLDTLQSQLAATRDEIATFLVLTEVGTRYAEREGLQIPEATPSEVAARFDFEDEDHPYVRVRAGFEAVLSALAQQVTATEPSEEDQREVHRNLRVQGQPLDIPFEQVREILNVEFIGFPVGLRDLLAEVVEQEDVRVQPGYELVYLVPVQIADATSFLAVRISEPSSVRDSS